MAKDPITFRASFPSIQTAIKVDGSGGGMRIQLDIPESEMAQAVHLLALRQCVIKVTVEPDEQPNRVGTIKRTTAKQRK